MRKRTPKHRILELQSWLKKNKTASWREFVAATGGTQIQYYHIRERLGITKNATLSEAMKQIHKRRREKLISKTTPDAAAIVAARNKENEEFLAGKQNSVLVEGNTPDFVWYEIDLIQRRLSDLSSRINHVMKVAQARDADQKKMMRELINENSEFRLNNNALRKQISELSEALNGTPV